MLRCDVYDYTFSERKVSEVICLNCGKEIDNDLQVCPFCGNLVEAFDDSVYFEKPLSGYSEESYEEGFAPVEIYAQEENYGEGEYAGDYDEHEDYEEEFVDDDPVYGKAKKGKKFSVPNVSMPKVSMPALPLSTILSALCLLLSLVCLISIKGVQKDIEESNKNLISNMNSIYASVSALDDRLASMDSTIAGVQNEAYNQLASQSIVISKDITALTGPVTEGKYNVMFIINAKGNLNLNDSFDWQKYNQVTGGWESIVFTGNATTNEQYGLRLENVFNREENHYESKLWANGITPEAAGTYRCVIKDATGITKTSAQATVQVG